MKLKEKSLEFKREVQERTLGYIVASFGLVAGLAWNDAIKALIETYFLLQSDTLKARFIYAIFITIIIVFISIYIVGSFKKKEEKK